MHVAQLRSCPLNPADLLYVLVIESEIIVVPRGVKTPPGVLVLLALAGLATLRRAAR